MRVGNKFILLTSMYSKDNYNSTSIYKVKIIENKLFIFTLYGFFVLYYLIY